MIQRNLTFSILMSNLMVAYKNLDIKKYLDCLDKLKEYLPDDIYSFYFNFSKQSLFTRKGYLKK